MVRSHDRVSDLVVQQSTRWDDHNLPSDQDLTFCAILFRFSDPDPSPENFRNKHVSFLTTKKNASLVPGQVVENDSLERKKKKKVVQDDSMSMG